MHAEEMPKRYDPTAFEKKWYAKWEDSAAFKPESCRGEKPFCIVIPPPNVTGKLHIGHALQFTLQDLFTRWRRMQGYNVLYPIGWDAFGLPTENRAIKTGKHPREVTQQNVANFRRQLKSLGLSFDWSR